MSMRPDGVNSSMGVVGVFGEAARLLRKHFRLFVPFILAFHLPLSCFTAFQTVFLSPTAPPRNMAIVLKASALFMATDQEGVMDADSQRSLLALGYGLSVLVFVFAILAVAATTYVVAHIYGNADSTGEGDDDGSVARKVFKLLPHAFLRMFVTQLWCILAFALLTVACVGFAFILTVAMDALMIGGPSEPNPTFFVLASVPLIIGFVVLSIKFALAPCVAVLEPEKYGREALKQSTAYVKGRALTIFGFLFLTGVIEGLPSGPLAAFADPEISLLVKIAMTILFSILISFVNTYAVIAAVVMYFVCKSNFESVLPEFQRGSNVSAAENPYKPIVTGSSEP